MQVTIGRIVWYQTIADHDTSMSKPLPAIVVKVNDNGSVNLKCFDEYDLYKQQILYSGTEPKPGCWRWPDKVAGEALPTQAENKSMITALQFKRMARQYAGLIPAYPEGLNSDNCPRAAGDAECMECKLPFADHMPSPEHEQDPGVRILCSGQRVKL